MENKNPYETCLKSTHRLGRIVSVITRILLIGGGGTLGTYTAKELSRLDCDVDIICPEEKTSADDRITFYRSYATPEFLDGLFQRRHYDGIVNFIHYPEYKVIVL